MMKWTLITIFAAGLLVGCGDDQDPDAAAALFKRIQDENYRSFARAPGYEMRLASTAPHGDEVDIYINDAIAEALSGESIDEWPVGSLIVKDGFSDGELDLIAAMDKRDDGWFWAEWTDTTGESAEFSGKPEVCTDCHAAGDDFVQAFALP